MFLKTLNASIPFLGLEYPVRVTTRTKDCRKLFAGDCNIIVGKSGIRYHQINLYLPTIIRCEFTLEGILAHELTHAWMFETEPCYSNVDYPPHDWQFVERAKLLQKQLKNEGINISMRDLYNPDTDTP